MADISTLPAGVLRVDKVRGDALIKEVTAEGSGDASDPASFPRVGDEVRAHYTGRLLDGTVFDSSVSRGTPFVFTLGRGEVIQCWDAGFATMRRGERAFLQGAPELCYGAGGSPPTIPPNATLRFEVELLSFGPKPKRLEEMSGAEKLAEALARKDAGNAALTGGDVRLALDEWAAGVAALDAGLLDLDPAALAPGAEGPPSWEEPLSEAQLAQLRAVRVALPANRAMAELKLGLFRDAAASATKALKFDPANVKSLFRRGSARAALGDLEDARDDLAEAARLAPADAGVRAELARIKKLHAAQREREKKAFGGWASKAGGIFGADEQPTPAAAPTAEASEPAAPSAHVHGPGCNH
jgi:peptidylprolyl isomerase